jgi:predicted CXXCH cytochrome family protein
MKKLIVLAALVLMAAPAFAGISGTAHDLSGNGIITGDDTAICIFCHTPHGGELSPPLWNRGPVANLATAITPYTSNTIDGGVNASDAAACISCHDGASLTGIVVTNLPATITAYDASGQIGLLTGGTNLGADLTNDHPVGVNLADAITAGDALKTPTNAVLYGSIVWCSSCHNVHDNAVVPFLRTSNVGSALCLDCHTK